MKDVLKGELIRLAAFDPEELGKAYAIWSRDSELKRLMDTSATRVYSDKACADFFKKMVDEAKPENHYFSIRALEDNRLLGDINLDVVWETTQEWLPALLEQLPAVRQDADNFSANKLQGQ